MKFNEDKFKVPTVGRNRHSCLWEIRSWFGISWVGKDLKVLVGHNLIGNQHCCCKKVKYRTVAYKEDCC